MRSAVPDRSPSLHSVVPGSMDRYRAVCAISASASMLLRSNGPPGVLRRRRRWTKSNGPRRKVSGCIVGSCSGTCFMFRMKSRCRRELSLIASSRIGKTSSKMSTRVSRSSSRASTSVVATAPSPSASRETIAPIPTAAPGSDLAEDTSAPRHPNAAAHQGIGGGRRFAFPNEDAAGAEGTIPHPLGDDRQLPGRDGAGHAAASSQVQDLLEEAECRTDAHFLLHFFASSACAASSTREAKTPDSFDARTARRTCIVNPSSRAWYSASERSVSRCPSPSRVRSASVLNRGARQSRPEAGQPTARPATSSTSPSTNSRKRRSEQMFEQFTTAGPDSRVRRSSGRDEWSAGPRVETKVPAAGRSARRRGVPCREGA